MENVVQAQTLEYQSGSGTWARPGDVVDHFGGALPADVVFFRDPPTDLGPLFSAYSTLRRAKEGKSVVVRLAIGLAVAVPIGVLTAYFIAQSQPRGSGDEFLLIIPIAAGLLAFSIAWWATRFSHVCSFVNAQGMTRYRLTGSRNAVAREERFRFDYATELRTSQTRQFVNGVYTGTSYDFKWTDATGRRIFRLNGTYKSKVGRPKPSNPFAFASAGEIAWSNHLLDALDGQLQKYGVVIFNVGKGKAVRVGRGYFEFDWGGEVARIATSEIKTINLNQGTFHIVHKDAGWFSRKGKFSFQYGSMANARLFLLAMDRLLGLRFGA